MTKTDGSLFNDVELAKALLKSLVDHERSLVEVLTRLGLIDTELHAVRVLQEEQIKQLKRRVIRLESVLGTGEEKNG